MTGSEPWVLAIDFGTSYTVAAAWSRDRAEVIEIGGERRVPSVIFAAEDGTIAVGRSAETLAAGDPGRALRAPKRRLGDPAASVLGGRPFEITELVAALLAHVREEAVRYMGSDPTSVRLTHPATWNRPRRQALLAAAARAGMEDAGLVPEPVAAAVAYASDGAIPLGGHVLVYDLGGGTFDTAALEATENGFAVIGRPGGDPNLGGELFDELVANELGRRLEPDDWEQLQISDDEAWRQAALRLQTEARRAKESLSSMPYADVFVGLPDGTIQERFTADDLRQLVEPYFTETVDVLERTAEAAGLTHADLDAIYLVGGASRAPMAEDMVRAAFPEVPVSRRGDPKGVVALGAVRPEADPDRIEQRATFDRSADAEVDAAAGIAGAAAAGAAAAGLAASTPADATPSVDPSAPVPDPSIPDAPAASAAPSPPAPASDEPSSPPPPADPATAIPATGPASYPPPAAAPPPPGTGPTPPGVPPGTPPGYPVGGPPSVPPSGGGNRKTLLIVGAIAAVLIVILGAGGAVVALRGDSTTTTTERVRRDPPETDPPSTPPPVATVDDALLERADFPSTWTQIASGEPTYPCGAPTVVPVDEAERAFADEAGVTVYQTVSDYGTEADAIAALDEAIASVTGCPTASLNIDGIDVTVEQSVVSDADLANILTTTCDDAAASLASITPADAVEPTIYIVNYVVRCGQYGQTYQIQAPTTELLDDPDALAAGNLSLQRFTAFAQ